MKFLDFQSGRKTYIVVAVGVALGIAQHFNIHIPSYVDWALAFLGMGTLRHAVTAQSAKSAAAVDDLVKLVLENITVAEPVPTIPVVTEPLPPLK